MLPSVQDTLLRTPRIGRASTLPEGTWLGSCVLQMPHDPGLFPTQANCERGHNSKQLLCREARMRSPSRKGFRSCSAGHCEGAHATADTGHGHLILNDRKQDWSTDPGKSDSSSPPQVQSFQAQCTQTRSTLPRAGKHSVRTQPTPPFTQ